MQKALEIQQWKNTLEVTEWFKSIGQKRLQSTNMGVRAVIINQLFIRGS